MIIVWSPDKIFFSTTACINPSEFKKNGTLFLARSNFVLFQRSSIGPENFFDKPNWDLDKILMFNGLLFENDFNAGLSLPRQKRNLGGFKDKLVKEFIVHP